MASIFESFLILFQIDNKELQKGEKDAKASTDRINAALESSNKKTQSLGTSFSSMVSQAKAALFAYVSASAIIGGFKAATQHADRLDELSKALNVNVEELSAWGDAVKKNGGTVEGFQATVQSMTASLSHFATRGTSAAAPFFKQLGISMVDSKKRARGFLELLPELADAFSKLSKAESFGIGQKIGLDQGTIMLLQQGRREVDSVIKRQKELGVVTKEDAEIAAKFNDAWDDTAHAFRSLFTTMGSTVLPVLTTFLKGMEDVALFFRKHSNLIIGAIIGISAAIVGFFLPAIISAVTAAAPFLLIGTVLAGVIALFAILYDDIRGFYAGHDSLLGHLISKYPKLGMILKSLEHGLKVFWGTLKEMGNTLLDIWDAVVSAITNSIQAIISAVDKVANAYQRVKSFLGLSGETVTNVGKPSPWQDEKRRNAMMALNASQQAFNTAGSHPILGQSVAGLITNNRSASKNTNIHIGEVNVETQATNASGIAASIGSDLNTQMRQAASEFDDGVMA